MQDIPKEYLLLFNTITDAVEQLSKLQQTLQQAQQTAEELYIGCGEAGGDPQRPCP